MTVNKPTTYMMPQQNQKADSVRFPMPNAINLRTFFKLSSTPYKIVPALRVLEAGCPVQHGFGGWIGEVYTIGDPRGGRGVRFGSGRFGFRGSRLGTVGRGLGLINHLTKQRTHVIDGHALTPHHAMLIISLPTNTRCYINELGV